MFRFDENVFRGGGAVKGPFFGKRDIFLFADDDDGGTCFTGRARYKAVVGNRFYQVISCEEYASYPDVPAGKSQGDEGSAGLL